MWHQAFVVLSVMSVCGRCYPGSFLRGQRRFFIFQGTSNCQCREKRKVFVINIFKIISKLLDNKKYRKNPVPQNLSKDQFAAINIGAINAEQTGYYCDSLSTGSSAADIKQNLSNYYDITDRDTALETLEWLFTSGHRVYFDLIKGVVSGQETQIDGSELDEDDIDRIKEYASNLQGAMESLVGYDFIKVKQPADLYQKSIAAWDMGRLVLVTRCCFDVGYISDEEAWRYIFQARQLSQKTYSSWEELASGYVIGRAMWSGNTMSLTGIIGITQDLLGDQESPWKQCSF